MKTVLCFWTKPSDKQWLVATDSELLMQECYWATGVCRIRHHLQLAAYAVQKCTAWSPTSPSNAHLQLCAVSWKYSPRKVQSFTYHIFKSSTPIERLFLAKISLKATPDRCTLSFPNILEKVSVSVVLQNNSKRLAPISQQCHFIVWAGALFTQTQNKGHRKKDI